MKAWAIKNYGKNSKLELLELARPVPEADEVLIKIKAASLNPVDFKIKEGGLRRIINYPLPLILGNDCAGTVEATGKDVTGFTAGDEVYCRVDKHKIGTLAEYVTVRASSVARKPRTLSFEEAASIPLVGLTSWQALLTVGKLSAGKKVFIPAGSGGVGSIAIQIAKHVGAYVATNTSGRNLQFVQGLGADQVIDYTKEDFSQTLRDFDLVFDTMGGETQRKSLEVLGPGGVIVSIVGPPTPEFAAEEGLGPLVKLGAFFLSDRLRRRCRRRGLGYHFLFMRPSGEELEELGALLDQGKLRPVVDRIYPFSKADEALSYLELGRARGKIVVSW